MTRAMKIKAMPTIGVVSRLVRRRASDSCSVAERGAQRCALGGERAGNWRAFGGAERGGGGDLFELLEAEIDARLVQRVGEAGAPRRAFAHPAAHLGEQPAVAGMGGLFQCALVAAVAGEQHRDDVEIRRELVPQIGPGSGSVLDRRDVNNQRHHSTAQHRDHDRYEPAQV